MIRRIVQSLPLLSLAGLGVFAIGALILDTPPANAQVQIPADRVCRAAMIIDRSGSVGGGNMQTIRNQIRRLFEPSSGIYDAKVELAMWSFSHDIGSIFGGPMGNYNAPHHDYISSVGPMSASFNSALNALYPAGNTNYQQAFAYDRTTRNPALNDIIEKTNILVFMTDGQPNSVNASGFGGPSPAEAGRLAAQQHRDAGRATLGGSIGANTAQVRTINYVVSNDENNYNNTFTVSSNYDDLSRKLKQEIVEKCNELFPPDPCQYNPSIPREDPRCVPPSADPPYSLVPLVTSDNTIISSDESVNFQYRVTNENAINTSEDTEWSIKRVVVDRGQSTDPLQYGSNTFRDGFSCAALLDLINNRGDCDDNIARGTKKFAPGATVLAANEVGQGGRLVIEDRWPVGTKVCYVLAVNKPTEKDSPVDRFSRAVCVVIGKRPTVHVYGGDLSVGKQFAGDSEPPSATASKVQAGITVKGDPVNRIFGSWVEYGVLAPGPVVGVASASGLEGGFPASGGALQGMWSKLTFANIADSYGSFTDAWTHPDTAGALLANGGSVTAVTEGDRSFNGSVNSGIYEKQSGDLRLTSGTLDKNSHVVVHVPNGTVTIDGNLEYNDGPYSSIKEIPRLVIIARAIHVKANVSRVDAWLIARNSATSTGGGTINTCSDGPVSLSINDCSGILRINGPVMARTLLLRRTAGAGSGEASGDPAEIINLRADAYLSSIANRGGTTVPMTTSTIELPPRF